MVHLSRLGTLTIVAGGVLSAPLLYAGPLELRAPANSPELLLASSSQGYLGVVLRDVDNERASTLKLKDAHGAEIVTIDQDAPAAKAGLKVHDVVVQMNGQRVEGVEQFRRMLRETPPGRTVSLGCMREGQSVNLTVQLADRDAIAIVPVDPTKPLPELADNSQIEGWIQPPPGSGRHSGGSSLFGYFTRDRYYTGVQLQPLTSGLAEYFGVHNGAGVLVGTVFPNSPAAAAGLKAADVIQKVNGQPIVSLADWEKAIRTFRGKQVQVTLIRDKKEQTVTMVAGEAKNSGELDAPELILPGDLPDAQALAELRSDLGGIDAAAIADQVRESMKDLDPEAIRKQAEQAAQSIDSKEIRKALAQSQQEFQENQKQIQRQMEDLRESLQSLRIEQMD